MANKLEVSFNSKSNNIDFVLNEVLVYDIGLEFCTTVLQINGWIAQLSEKRWIKESDGIALFLAVLSEIQEKEKWRESA
jgi:hypothetical protein